MQMMNISLADDLLEGAKAIAEFTGFNQDLIYKLGRTPGHPIEKKPGQGLVACKSALLKYYGSELTPEAAEKLET